MVVDSRRPRSLGVAIGHSRLLVEKLSSPLKMPTASEGHCGVTDLPTVFVDEKDEAAQLHQCSLSLRPTDTLKRIPAEFVDTPRLQQPTVPVVSPMSLVNQKPISATLPVTLSEGGYPNHAPPVSVVRPRYALEQRQIVQKFAGDPSHESWITRYTSPNYVSNPQVVPVVQGSCSKQRPAQTTGRKLMEDPFSLRPLDSVRNTTIGYPFFGQSSEAVTTVNRYRLTRSSVPKVLPMKEVEYCTGLEGRRRPFFHPSVTTVNHSPLVLSCVPSYS